MTRNPNDSSLQAQIDELRKLLRANPLRSASVEAGRTRFYSGSELLIEDSNLTVSGTATVFGTLRTVGRIILEGLGILTVNGLIELFGMMRVRGGGSITVEDGGDVVVNGGKIKAGNVEIRDGKIYVGTGAGQVIIDGATGKIIAGNLTIDPNASGGSITFGDGRTINASETGIGIYDGERFVVFNADGVTMYAGGSAVSVGAFGVRMDGLQTITESDSGGLKPGSHYSGPSGVVYVVVPD